jgi:hypothetical protein
MSFWGFFHDDDGGAAPDMEEFPYLSDAGPGVLTSSPPVRRAAPCFFINLLVFFLRGPVRGTERRAFSRFLTLPRGFISGGRSRP